ncbi:response regulator [Flavisolibacter tropicus]|uniref:Transcriptional regulator n=1 Tax=Flavisolibacter tropicus TaxID=1492898 RepID=A0A172TS77_9BACT|nr:response regulator [Flavisolibacter tropicus]ANE49939.1 transcriptional regulator [Flavisolibacter tropicus]
MKKILVIEDNISLLENTAELLELSNYHVLTAENGRQGIEVAIKEKPDLILCDIMMPEVDGYGVLQVLNQHSDLSRTPFIFLSAKSDRSDFRKGMDLGADDYISKPFTATELLNAIQRRLQKSESIRQVFAKGIKDDNQLYLSVSGEQTLNHFIDGRGISNFKKKQVVYFEGNHPLFLFHVKKGKVKTFKTNDDGKELITGLYNSGEFFGYVSMLEGATYKETAQAVEDAELISIPKSEFEELIYHNAEVAKSFIKLLSHNLVEKEQQLLNIAYNSLRKKVADALLLMKEKLSYAQPEGLHSIQLSRENMAAIAGTATESFIRTLTDFKNEKLIDIKDGHIVILNEVKLKNMRN